MSSSPILPAILERNSVGRVPGLYPVSREFESLRSDFIMYLQDSLPIRSLTRWGSLEGMTTLLYAGMVELADTAVSNTACESSTCSSQVIRISQFSIMV